MKKSSHLIASPWFGVERSLTLIQIGLKSKDCYIIKLNRENYNAPNLVKFLSKNSTQFIMHYARQDLLWLKHHLNVEPPNILY